MATKQNSGVVDGSGNPVLDGSGNPIMSGRFPDEDEITARGRARNAAMFRSFANRLTGKKKEAKKAAPAVSRPTRPGQETSGAKPAASKPVASKTKPAAKATPAVVTKEELAKSGLSLRDYMNKQRGLTRRNGKAPEKAKPSTPAAAKPNIDAAQRKRSDMIVALTKAEKDASAGTSDLAKKKIAESRRKLLAEYATAGKAEERKNYKPRPTPGARAPKQTTSKPKSKPYMPDAPDMTFRKGGKVCMASKRADGIAQSGKTRGKVY